VLVISYRVGTYTSLLPFCCD